MMCMAPFEKSCDHVSMDRFSENLRQRARLLGLSHAEVARRAGLTDRRFGNYVAGIREPDLATLVRIASSLETTPDELLGIERTPAKASAARAEIGQLIDTIPDAHLEVLAVQLRALVRHFRANEATER